MTNERGQSWSRGFDPGTAGMAVATMASLAFRNHPIGRIATLAKLLLRQNALRGPMPTHRPAGSDGNGGLPAGWSSTEACGGADERWSEGHTGPLGTCTSWPFVFGPPGVSDTTALNPAQPNITGWRYPEPGLRPDSTFWDVTRHYQRVSGTEPFAWAPDRRWIPLVPDTVEPPKKPFEPTRKPGDRPKDRPKRSPARPVPARPGPRPYGPRPGPFTPGPSEPGSPGPWPGVPGPGPGPRPHRPLSPRRPVFPDLPPQENPQAPGYNPLEPSGPGAPAPVPYPLVPGMPDLGPDGEPIRGPVVRPRPAYDPAPHVPVPVIDTPPPLPGTNDPPTKPWERPNDRVVSDPQFGTWKDREPHKNMPPLHRHKEIKFYFRVQTPVVKKLGEATEYCDLAESLFKALKPETRAKYDSREFLHNKRPNLLTENEGIPSLVSEAFKGNWAHYKTGIRPKPKGADWAKMRQAFNQRNAETPDPLMRSKWGRKPTCQVMARAVYENFHELQNQEQAGEAFWNIIQNEAEDRGIGKLGKGAADFSKATKNWLGLGARGI